MLKVQKKIFHDFHEFLRIQAFDRFLEKKSVRSFFRHTVSQAMQKYSSIRIRPTTTMTKVSHSHSNGVFFIPDVRQLHCSVGFLNKSKLNKPGRAEDNLGCPHFKTKLSNFVRSD